MSPAEYETARGDTAVSWGLGSGVVAGIVGATAGGAVLIGALASAMAYNTDPE
jgi:hypothetical protein